MMKKSLMVFLTGIALLTVPSRSQTWTPLGPYGDTILSLAASPSNLRVLYAGGGAGVFRSTDAGASWQSLPGSPGSSLLAVDPKRPTTVYAASQIYVSRLEKSTDGGAHWALATRGLPGNLTISGVEVDPARPDRVYLATSQGVWRSGDGGATWRSASQGLPGTGLAAYVTALAAARKPAGTAFAGTAEGGLYRTRDAGKSWQKLPGLPDGLVEALAIAPSDPRTLYASFSNPATNARRGIYRSRDGGSSWSPAGDPGATPVIALAVHPRSPRTVYAETLIPAMVFKTTDGGGHWTPTAKPPTGRLYALILDPSGAVSVGAGAAGTDLGGVLRSADGGASWTRTNRGLTGLTADSVAVDPADGDNLAAALPGPGVFRSANGGARWARTPAGLPSVPGFGVSALEVLAPAPGTFYAVDFGNALIWKSTDAGLTWTSTPGPGQRVRFLRADPLDPDTLYALAFGVPGNDLYRSTDGGEHWVRLAGLPQNCEIAGLTVARTSVSATAPAMLYLAGSRVKDAAAGCQFLATRPAVFRSSDGGASWTVADAGLPGDFAAEVAVDPRAPRILYTGQGNIGSPLRLGLWKSTDAGASWQASGLQDRIVFRVAASPTGSIWAATLDGKVFRSEDAGASWQDRSGGLAFTVFDFTFDPTNPGRVYIAGFGGVWVTTEYEEP